MERAITELGRTTSCGNGHLKRSNDHKEPEGESPDQKAESKSLLRRFLQVSAMG